MAIDNMDHIENSETPTTEGSTTRKYQKNVHGKCLKVKA